MKNKTNIIDTAQLELFAQVIDRFLVGRPISRNGLQSQKNRSGCGLDFLDHRPYIAGDDPRFIDWRMTMKHQTPYIRRFQNEAASNWVICLDRSTSMSLFDNEKWKLAIQLAAAWAFILLRKGQYVSLLVYSDDLDAYIPSGRGKLHYASLIKCLKNTTTATDTEKTNLQKCIKKINKNSAAVVISDFAYAEAFKQGLADIAAICSDMHAFTLLSKNDFLNEDDDAYFVKDVETQEKTLMNSASIKKRANMVLTDWVNFMEKESQIHGIVNSINYSDQPWNLHFLNHFKKIQRVHA